MIGRGVLGSGVVALAGFWSSRLPRSSWARDWAPLTALRSMPHHAELALGLGLTGLLLLASAWWGLREYARDDESGVMQVRAAVVAWAAPMLVAPPLLSGDGWSYVATGYLTGHDRSPYVATASELPADWQSAVSHRWLHTPSPYGPLPHAWGGLVTNFVNSPWQALMAYRLFALFGVALLAWAVPRLATRCGTHAGTASWLVLASPFMLANGVGGLHLDVVVAGLGAVALAVTTRERWYAAAVLVGLATAVKAPGGLVAVGVVLLSLPPAASYVQRIRRSLEVAGVVALTVTVVGVVSGLGFGWISALSHQGSMSGRLSVSHDLGWVLDRLVDLSGLGAALGSPDLVRVVETVGMGAVVVAAALVLLRLPLGEDPRILRAVGVVALAATVLIPVVHYWYFLWCLPLVAVVPLARPWRGAIVGTVLALGIVSAGNGTLYLSWLAPATTLLLVLGPALGYGVAARRSAPATSASRQPATF